MRSSRWALLAQLSSLLLLLGGGAGLPGCGETKDEPGKGRTTGASSGRYDSGLDRPPADAGSAQSSERLPPPAFQFVDRTAFSGMAPVNHSGKLGVKEYLLEAVGVGPACFDYDRDGLMDFYVPDGDVFANYDLVKEPDPANPSVFRPVLKRKAVAVETYRDQLWHNLGNGTFEDVTEKAGVGDERWSFGALAWDYDADGWTDIFLSNFGKCRLWHNNGNGTFTDVAEAVGLVGDETQWNTCASCGDYDGDGRLDLFVGRYADPAIEVERQRINRKLPEGTPVTDIKGRWCRWRGLDAYCGPLGLTGQFDSIYRQQEDGTFRETTKEVGMAPKAGKYAFTSYWFDYDGDGLLDIYVANDSEENFLWHQERDAKGRISFKDVAETAGVKFGQQQNAQASMGCCIQDINQDGLIDIFVTNFSHDYNNIFVGHKFPGGVSFKDRGLQMMGQAVFYDLSWGCGWYDFDLDADLDLFVANGHVYQEIDLFEKTGTAYDQYSAVFETLDAQKLKCREVGPKPFRGPNAKPPPGLKEKDLFAGTGLEVKKCNRAACFNDYDNDGDVDVVVFSMNATPTFLRNDLPAGPDRGWLKLMPRQPGPNRDAIGATVYVTTEGGPTQMFPVYRCQSFLGTDDPRLPVGVGKATRATVKIVWPGPATTRATTTYADLPTNQAYELTPDGVAKPVALPPVRQPN